LARILFFHHIYERILDTPGVIMEFGTRWGQNLAILAALRGIYEPFNRHRTIVGFDTFTGFPTIHSKDGASDLMRVGNLALPNGYPEYLSQVLQCIEQDNPINHIKKYEVVPGDVIHTLPSFMERHPETVVAFAYLDMDVYEPTKFVLETLAPRLTRGSILGFDEVGDPDSPGETLALLETFGLRNVRLKRHRFASRVSYFIVEQ
jgi:hypothetical protein